MRRAAIAVTVLALAGCGGESADLFEVQRSGADKNANVDLVVNDGGTVRCNKGESRTLPGKELLDARELARDLEKQASLSIELPAGKNPVLSYRVRVSNGSVSFSDASPDRPKAFDRLVAFSKDVIEDVCKIER